MMLKRFAIALLALGAVAAAPPDLSGRWRLVVLPFGADEFVLFDLKGPADAPEGAAVSTQSFLGDVSKIEVGREGDEVTIRFATPRTPLTFRGRPAADGRVLGTASLSGTTYPARLEKSTADKVADLKPSPVRLAVAEASREADPKARVEKLAALIEKNAGEPFAAFAYAALLTAAEAAGLDEAQVRARVAAWTDEARPYGPAWMADVRGRALKALLDRPAYAKLATELAREAEAALPADAADDARASVYGMLARSARLAGEDELARTAEARAKEIEAKLDEEYHRTVPPFKPAEFAGRKDAKADRAVVMEIFTGAECPPCVGADVGFDALLKTYRPTEFIGLQYHLHIPGPDPLTNDDSVARQNYYGEEVRGTPTTFFDGKRAGGSGGFMQHAEAKYNEYRAVIDPALESPKRAEITLSATRAGDEVRIEATAAAEAVGGAKPRLRLVLVEESVRYPGGNKLRFHHNVVRAFPGGVEGKALEGGKAEVTAVVKLADVRKAQLAYVEKFSTESGRSFPHPLPPIDLDDLAVVAIVQDDADHAIWQGRQVPVQVVNP